MITCNECKYQNKFFHNDKRCKGGGYMLYSCKLNGDPFVSHAVNGKPKEFCSSAKAKEA
jgi:hypothetical protein